MNSEFFHVELNTIRYSLVWEDSSTFFDALDIGPDDHVMVITSAGCNVLNAVLKKPASVTAVDLNPVQNKLLSFKQHVITHHSYAIFRSILGFDGKDAVQIAKKEIINTLSENDQMYWSSFFEAHPNGLMTAGKLENYITRFYSTLSADIQDKLSQLITFTEIEKQYNYFIEHLDHSEFKNLFINYFDDDNLSKGRDPKLLKYATETGGQAFYNRLVQQVKSTLVANNFYFRFFFCGPLNLPDSILPPCYQPGNYQKLQKNVYSINIRTAEAIDFLLSNEALQINKASLSNIFEYTSKEEFNRVISALSTYGKKELNIVFWNLLNDQGSTIDDNQQTGFIQHISPSPQGCFYFKNVVLLRFAHSHSHQSTLL
jgi:S-adenosylmethionine-diacylglycerol 3-amino-3-carboxypropyl transferase